MFKPKLHKLFIGGKYFGWMAVQDWHYRVGQTPKEAYDKLKEVYDYYHNWQK